MTSFYFLNIEKYIFANNFYETIAIIFEFTDIQLLILMMKNIANPSEVFINFIQENVIMIVTREVSILFHDRL